MASRYYFPQETTVLPLLSSREVRGPRRVDPIKEYHVQIAGCTELGGRAVKDKCVKMTEEQAQYWLDQGVLGTAAGEHHAGAALGKKK